MNTNIFNSIILTSLSILCFSNNLHATLEIKQKNNFQANDDTYIRNFVRGIGSNKVSYDGKNLILYANPGSNTNAYFSLSFAICTIFGLACLNSDEQKIKVGGGLLALFFDTLCVLNLIKNLYYENNNIPFITITNAGISVWDDQKVSWNRIYRLKYEKIIKNGMAYLDESKVHLCDAYLNSILTIDDKKYLPISFDNLIAILEHYIEKTRQKNKSLNH